jgi:hypothetical protein
VPRRALLWGSMDERGGPDESTGEEEQPRPRLAWEVIEIVGACVLVTIAILAAGAVAAGIGQSVDTSPFLTTTVWDAIEVSSLWASPVVALLLLGVLGLCWWQLEAWSEVMDGPDEEDVADGLGHTRRARMMAVWTVVALILTGVGSVAGFAARLGSDIGGDTVWTIDVAAGASMIAVLVVLASAGLVGRQLSRQYGR